MRTISLPFIAALVIAFAASFPAAAAAGGGTPPDSSGFLPYVNEVGTKPSPACSGPPISLVLKGEFPDACGQVVDAQVFDPGHVSLTLKIGALPDTACPLVFTPWHADFNLGVLPVGGHVTEIALVVISVDSINGGLRRDFYNRSHTFMVLDSCDTIPPVLPGLPYVHRIVIGRDEICHSNEACPGDSIPVRIDGAFPNDCFSLRGIELVPVIAPAFGPPPPPIVRLIVDDGGCILRICNNEPAPWTARTKLPPMATPGRYKLEVQLAQVTCSDHYPPGTLYRTQVPFQVAERCDPPPPCLTAGFGFGPDSGTVCNATVAPGRPAELRFMVAPTVALAGLQGEIRLEPAALIVQGIQAVGVARGMLLNWTRTPNGARFVLFSTVGAPIPSWPPTNMDPRGGGWPVLNVVVGRDTDNVIPPRTGVFADALLGSDIDGNAVRLCPPPPCVDGGMRDPALHGAIICAELGCDFNADGFEDVRDLVLMAHCVIGVGQCPPDAGVRFDCDGDSTLGVPDVICCARHMLQRPPCPGCGPDSLRPEPRVSVSFGMPEADGNDIALPVRIAGTSLLGAAMLTLEAPIDRYEVTGFAVDPPGNWLTLHEAQNGRVVLGLIDVRGGNERAVLDNARFTLHLRLRAGEQPGGIVTATAGQFSGPDGVALGVELGHPTQALPGSAVGGLGPNQPNPFSRETAFTLETAQTGHVTVTIYDLRGRAVAKLHEGQLEAGPHVFRWDGRRSDGNLSPNGVYFYQATVSGASTARKLILMRN